ncbi:MAG: thiamine pyrophosphate-dependent enzyme, partial [Aeropyrum sp.]|nr:thiamine pyrophosphate-dependent enzyme [Aeropyrum sp.]
LANAVYNRIPLLLLVLDNMTTAMTGHQPHPGVGLRADGSRGMRLAPENVAEALGVGFVEVVDSFNVAEVEGAVERAIEYLKSGEGPAVLVARGSCILVAPEGGKARGAEAPGVRGPRG